MKKVKLLFTLILICLIPPCGQAQIIQVGSGSYTKTFPGTDSAGRNGFPSGSPQLCGKALGKPVPTNDWWSKLVKENHTDNLFNYPFTMKTVNQGLVVSYIPNGVIDDLLPITIGVSGLNAPKATISDYSDWTVKMDWNDGTHQFDVTSGIGMPFLYVTQKTGETAQVTVTSGKVTIKSEMLLIENAKHGASFAVYAPAGSSWITKGTTYTSTLNGKSYWSVAMLPQNQTNIAGIAEEYKAYAYVFPVSTSADYTYNEANSTVRTEFTINTEVKEGQNNLMLQGLLPHQWNNLSPDSPKPDKYKYTSIRGELKMLAGNHFEVENKFSGILPTLPYLDNDSKGFNPSALNEKINAIKYDLIGTWTDSYNDGQLLNRLIQTARIADECGQTDALASMLKTVKERLENWLTTKNGEVAFLFYYNDTWSALLGYPAGHGQDNNINDHHFHWGYFIHAAAFVAQYDPEWIGKWGDMINLLVRDAATTDRQDKMFPFLRNFSPYAGHSWANGFATFPQGNDQESTSESMQFNSSLIHWGCISGNKAIRDLGIYLYTTEQTAIEEYWLNIHKRNFKEGYPYSLVSRVWGNNYDNGTFWTNDIAASYGIEMYPIHGGSLYLGHHPEYATALWEEIKKNTGIMRNEANDNLWHDVMWEYLAFTDPEAAIKLYDSYPNRSLKFGISDAQTYHWLHAMNALGRVDPNITADYPVAAAFNKDGQITYVAYNYGSEPIKVRFSTGYELEAAPRKMSDNRSSNITGELTTSFNQAYLNGSVTLSLTVANGNPTRVEFYESSQPIGEKTVAPYQLEVQGLSAGVHNFYARIYDGERYNISNSVTVTVGEQQPYGGTAWPVPGTIESGMYDEFEGGPGQNISYFDVTTSNSGNTRKDEYVDVTTLPSEGATIGYIAAGEWVEYTIDVANPGLYSLSLRYASGNNAGGGPCSISLDEVQVGQAITLPSTGGWETWTSRTATNLPLKGGRNVMRLSFADGEFNLGKLTFTRTADLPYSQPVANAGGNQKISLTDDSVQLDGSESYDPTHQTLSYEWVQVYGPSPIQFSNANAATTQAGGLKEGIYKVRLKVANTDKYADSDEKLIIVSESGNLAPTISISSPSDLSSFIENTEIIIKANAKDLDGSISKVDFFADDKLIGSSATAPFQISWSISFGEHLITARAIDNEGATAVSKAIHISGIAAPSCEGMSANGDYSYRFSEDKANPTLTFIPKNSSIGASLCLLYYGTNASGPLPGMAVTPNVPFRLTAAKGATIYFYYTYSTSSGERTTIDNKDIFVVGTCQGTGISNEAPSGTLTQYHPNPVTDILHLSMSGTAHQLMVCDISGKLIEITPVYDNTFDLNMSNYHSGIYLITINYGDRIEHLKVIKR